MADKPNKKKCVFTTSIADTTECCKNGNFDFNGFPINECNEYPCNKLKNIRNEDKEINLCQKN